MKNLQINEMNILKVVEWAHRQDIKVEKLKKEDILYALKVYLKESSHA